MYSIAKLRTKLRNRVVGLRREWLCRAWGMDIGEGTRISTKSVLDRTNPKGIHIGVDTGIGANAVILTHDFLKTQHVDTYIGSRCHIGVSAIVLPGITIGDDCIVAPGSVVMRNVPDGSLVSGNPARVIESGLELGPWGIREWDGKR